MNRRLETQLREGHEIITALAPLLDETLAERPKPWDAATKARQRLAEAHMRGVMFGLSLIRLAGGRRHVLQAFLDGYRGRLRHDGTNRAARHIRP